jgi:hypothetical protein
MQEQIDLARPGAISGGDLGGSPSRYQAKGRPALRAMDLSADGAARMIVHPPHLSRRTTSRQHAEMARRVFR